jgi:hypothetical protein
MAEKRSGSRRRTTAAAERSNGSNKETASRTEKRGDSRKQTTGRAEKRTDNKKDTTGRTDKRAAEQPSAEQHGADRKRTTAGKAHQSATEAGRNGLSAADAVSRARGTLAALLGLPVEGVLGIDRDGANWVATVQVLELARIPNTTDVLGEYETVLDGHGEVIRYHRTRRYHRGQVEGSER